MADAVGAHHLTVGDIVSVGDGVVGLPVKVTGITDDVIFLETLSGAPQPVGRAGAKFRILRFANGIPNTPAIAWLDPDRREHFAWQSGHPLNHSWNYNGRFVGEDDILAVAQGMPIQGLTWSDVPRG